VTVDFDTAAYSIDGWPAGECVTVDFDTAAYSIDGHAPAG